MLSNVITPTRTRNNFCEEKLLSPWGCRCHPAQYSQLCQSCHKRIQLGDCINHNNTPGWVHTKCPTENGTNERGARTIEAEFNNVDYGSSFLQRLTSNENVEQRLIPPPLHLTFDGEQDDDTKMPATVEKGSHKRSVEITQDSDEDEEPDEGDNELDDDDAKRRSRKRAKHKDTALTVLIDNSQGHYQSKRELMSK